MTTPVHLKSKLDYITLDPANFKPGPKNSHLSEIDPDFAAARPFLDKAMDDVWAITEVGPFREAWDMPQPLPDGWPAEGKEVVTSLRRVPVRDGADVEIKIYKSPQVKPDAAMVIKFHGGGWVVGDHKLESVDNLMVAAHPEVVVVSVNYRMAPEHPFPTPVNDCFDALKWCQANASSLGVNPKKIIIAGTSAGGNLAAVVTLLARDAGLEGIIGQLLNFPATCHPKFIDSLKDKYELLSYHQNHDASVTDPAKMEYFYDAYLGTNPEPDPRHSPLLSKDLKGLPPTLVQVAGFDVLRDEAIAYAEALQSAGNDVSVYTYKGLPHIFTAILVNHPQSQLASKRHDDFIMNLVRK